MPSPIRSAIGSVRVEKHRRHARRPYLRAEIRVTFVREEDGALFVMTRNDYEVSARSEMTHRWLQAHITATLNERSEEVTSLRLRSVEVVAVETVWNTPFEDLYPSEKEEGAS